MDTAIQTELEALGINAVPALVRFDNDEEFYLRILRSFVTHAPANIGIAKSSIQDLNAYRIAVHSLKGSGRGIGSEKIGDMAEKLENAAKQGDTAFIEAHNGPFIEAAEKFIASVSAFLQTLPDKEDSAKPEKDAPDPKLLAAVKQAAENYDMAALQEAIKSLDIWRYRSRPDLVKSLREKAGKSDFEGILNFISA